MIYGPLAYSRLIYHKPKGILSRILSASDWPRDLSVCLSLSLHLCLSPSLHLSISVYVFVCLRAFTLAANGCRLANHSLPPGRLSWHGLPTRACFVYVFGDGFWPNENALFFLSTLPLCIPASGSGNGLGSGSWSDSGSGSGSWSCSCSCCLSAVGLALSLSHSLLLSISLSFSLPLSLSLSGFGSESDSDSGSGSMAEPVAL